MKNLLKKETKGFTLIEIVLVLAIAGLIMVIVLLAVSGAQRSRRDTQRKQDASRMFTAVGNYASNNDGNLPAAFTDAGFSSYIPSNLKSPQTGSAYSYTVNTATPALDQMSLWVGHSCAGASTGSRTYAVYLGLESGIACRDDN